MGRRQRLKVFLFFSSEKKNLLASIHLAASIAFPPGLACAHGRSKLLELHLVHR
jgi:hypothetical protein